MKFNYFAPIMEVVQDPATPNGLKIRGVAIEATMSKNGRNYRAEELQKSIKTMEGVAIGLNHSGDVEDNVGIVFGSHFDGVTNKGFYEGIIHDTAKHPGITDMVKKGLIKHVSIEADATLEEDDNGVIDAKGLTFTGLDFVKTPGIAGTTVGVAEAFEQLYEKTKKENKKGDDELTEEIKTPEKTGPSLEEQLSKMKEENELLKKALAEDVEKEPQTELKKQEPAPTESVDIDKIVQEKVQKALLKEKAKGIGIVGNQVAEQKTTGKVRIFAENGNWCVQEDNPWSDNARLRNLPSLEITGA